MATGDITATNIGTHNISGADFLAALEAQNVGGATAGASTADLVCVPHGNGQATIFKLARSA